MLIIKLILIVNLTGMLNFLLGIIIINLAITQGRVFSFFFLLRKVRLFVDIYYTEITSAHLVLRKQGSSVYLMCE